MTRNHILDAEQKFYTFLATHGHPLDGPINHDSSKFHFLKCPNGNPTDARYKFFSDGIPSAYFCCWKHGIAESFCSKQRHEISVGEWREHIKRMEEYKLQNERERQQRHTVTAKEANRIWEIAEKITDANISKMAYLVLKNVSAYGLRYLAQDVVYEVYPKEYDINGNEIVHVVYRDTLLIPAYNANNELVNLERIYFSKKENKFQKRPLKGGQRIGAFYILGKAIDHQEIICIGEGYSTMAVVHESTGFLSVISFNCGNLPHVTKTLRQKHPQSHFLIIADDDQWHDDPKLRDVGLKAAKKACAEIKNATYLLPDFDVLEVSRE